MNTFPNELGGTHPLAAWGNKLLRASRAAALCKGRGYKLNATAAGTVLQIESETGGVHHPFKISNGTSWLEFNVAPGYVITTGAPFLPTGITELDGTLHPHTITSPYANFYVVLAILSASSAAVSTSSTLPTFATDIIPLGWIDTSTYAASSRSVIYQFWRDNVFSPCIT